MYANIYNLASVCDFLVLHVKLIVFFCLLLMYIEQTDKTEERRSKTIS